MLTVGVHAMSLLQGLPNFDHGSQQIHMMTIIKNIQPHREGKFIKGKINFEHGVLNVPYPF